jgi:hypothetical protein
VFSPQEKHLDDFGKCRSDWSRPLVPKQKDFFGKISYVDDECQIFVIPNEYLKELSAMESELSTLCQQNARRCDHLGVNDCIFAKYPDNGQWYRGKISEISADSKTQSMVRVLFVDYGEQKWVLRSECRGGIPRHFLDIPIKALRCKLDGVVPISGKYSTKFLNRVHAEIVDHGVHVRRTKCTLPVFPLAVVMHLDGDAGTDLAQKFIKEG